MKERPRPDLNFRVKGSQGTAGSILRILNALAIEPEAAVWRVGTASDEDESWLVYFRDELSFGAQWNKANEATLDRSLIEIPWAQFELFLKSEGGFVWGDIFCIQGGQAQFRLKVFDGHCYWLFMLNEDRHDYRDLLRKELPEIRAWDPQVREYAAEL